MSLNKYDIHNNYIQHNNTQHDKKKYVIWYK
jgi:hypothetical protein